MTEFSENNLREVRPVKKETNKTAVARFIGDAIGDNLNNCTIEENAGSMWITDSEGNVFSIGVIKCEPDLEI